MTILVFLTVALAFGASATVLGLVLSVVSVVAGIAAQPKLVMPQSYHAERLEVRPLPTGGFAPDLAWPVYPVRQVQADLARVAEDWRTRYGQMQHAMREALTGLGCAGLVAGPFVLLAMLFVLIASIASGLVITVFTLVVLALTVMLGIASGLVVAAMRTAEWTWQRLRGAEASCPYCYHVSARPAYCCPGCSAMHRDVRPGRFGVFVRRCECSTTLPTMVLRAAGRLEALCQRCGEPLREGAGAVRDVRFPIFGAVSAGKTRLLYAALDSLAATAGRAGTTVGFPDQDSQRRAELAGEIIRSGCDTDKTRTELPTALTCRLGSGPTSTLVHLFDAAGEHYRGSESHDDLGFLGAGQGLIYVLDPFAVDAVRAELGSETAMSAHAADGDPETAYGEVVTRLRNDGVEARTQRLAVVVSKVDLLTAAGVEVPTESEAIAAWLTRSGMHNIVLAARREFAEVRYFAVASLSAATSMPGREPGTPLRWLLRARGVRLPAEPPRQAPAPPPAKPLEANP